MPAAIALCASLARAMHRLFYVDMVERVIAGRVQDRHMAVKAETPARQIEHSAIDGSAPAAI